MPKFIPPFTVIATKVVGTIGRWRPDVRVTELPEQFKSRHEAERHASESSRRDQFSTQYNVMARHSEGGEPFWVTIYRDGWLKDANMRGSYEPPDQLRRRDEDEAHFRAVKATGRRVPRFVQGARANDSPIRVHPVEELSRMTKLLAHHKVKDPAARAHRYMKQGMGFGELAFRLGAGERLSPTKGTREIVYRGWIIRKSEGTQIGHTLPNSRNISQRIGTRTHRKWQGYEIQYPESEGTGGRVKLVDTLKEAKEYIDSYLGSSASPRAPRPSPRPDAIGSLVHRAATKALRIFKK